MALRARTPALGAAERRVGAGQLGARSGNVTLRTATAQALKHLNTPQATKWDGTVFNNPRHLPRGDRGPQAPPLRKRGVISGAGLEMEAQRASGPRVLAPPGHKALPSQEDGFLCHFRFYLK